MQPAQSLGSEFLPAGTSSSCGWQPPPGAEGAELSTLERECCDSNSGLNKCKRALQELNDSARKLVKDGLAGFDSSLAADFVRDAAERRELDELLHAKTAAKIMVMGEVNCGKSMLINTLMHFGEGTIKSPGLLPTTNKPCTSRITLLKYAESPTVELHAGRNCDSEEVKMLEESWTAHLRSGGSLHGLLGRDRGASSAPDPPPEDVLQVALGLPLDVLRAGIEVVDSPGLGENAELNALVCSHLAFNPMQPHLRPADAVLYVIKADAGSLRESDLSGLSSIPDDVKRRVMIVVTKVDLLILAANDDDEEDALQVGLTSLFTRAQAVCGLSLITGSSYEECPYFCPVGSKRTNWGKNGGAELRDMFLKFESAFFSLLRPALWSPLSMHLHGSIARLGLAMQRYEAYVLTSREETVTKLDDLKRIKPEVDSILKSVTEKMDAMLRDDKHRLHALLEHHLKLFRESHKDALLGIAAAFAHANLCVKHPTGDEKRAVAASLAAHLSNWLQDELAADKAVQQGLQEYEKALLDMSNEAAQRLRSLRGNGAEQLICDAVKGSYAPVIPSTSDEPALWRSLLSRSAQLHLAGRGLDVLTGLTYLAFMSSAVGSTAEAVLGGAVLVCGGGAILLTAVGGIGLAVCASAWIYDRSTGMNWDKYRATVATKLLEQLDGTSMKQGLMTCPPLLQQVFETELKLSEEVLQRRLTQDIRAWETTKHAFRAKLNSLELLRAWANTCAQPFGSADLLPFNSKPVLSGALGKDVSSSCVDRDKRIELHLDGAEALDADPLVCGQLGSAIFQMKERRMAQLAQLRLIEAEFKRIPAQAENAAAAAREGVFETTRAEIQQVASDQWEYVRPRDDLETIKEAEEAAAQARERVMAQSAQLERQRNACLDDMNCSPSFIAFYPLSRAGRSCSVADASVYRVVLRAPHRDFNLAGLFARARELGSGGANGEADALAIALELATCLEDCTSSKDQAAFVGEVSTLCFPWGAPPEVQPPNPSRAHAVLAQEGWGTAASWCLGVLFSMVITGGKAPFESKDGYGGVSIAEALADDVARVRNLPFGNELLHQCLQVDASLRPSLAVVVPQLHNLIGERRRAAEQADLTEKLHGQDGFALSPLDSDAGTDRDILLALKALLITDPEKLNVNGAYDNLKLAAAWRIEHAQNRAKYDLGVQRVAQEMQMFASQGVDAQAQCSMPAACRDDAFSLNPTANEAVLLHGTQPPHVLSVLSNGLSVRFAGTTAGNAFGDGLYLAEDVGKTDQYSTVDVKLRPDSDMHKRLYSSTTAHPGNVLYVLVCRAALGYPVRTQSSGMKAVSMDTGEPIFPRTYRELGPVRGVNPPRFYHSLVVELGGILRRYREFVSFHDEYVYPDFLVAYQRCKGNNVIGPAD